MQHVVVMTLNMLVKVNRSMTKTSALALCKMMELMKVCTYVCVYVPPPSVCMRVAIYNIRT